MPIQIFRSSRFASFLIISAAPLLRLHSAMSAPSWSAAASAGSRVADGANSAASTVATFAGPSDEDIDHVSPISSGSEDIKNTAHMSPVTSASEDDVGPPVATGAARARRARKSKKKLNQEAHTRQYKRECRDTWWKAYPGMPFWMQPGSIQRKSPPVKMPRRNPQVVPPPSRTKQMAETTDMNVATGRAPQPKPVVVPPPKKPTPK